MTTSTTDARIHLRAYYLWEADGRPEGHAYEYWMKARAMLEKETGNVVLTNEVAATGRGNERTATSPDEVVRPSTLIKKQPTKHSSPTAGIKHSLPNEKMKNSR